MKSHWLDTVDDIRREKFGDAEDLRGEGPAGQLRFLKNSLLFMLAVGGGVILLRLFFS